MHESGENYLETILVIKERKGTVRSIDIARELSFSKPSERAEEIYGRHRLLTAFLKDVAGVTEEMAERNACRMEHILDQEVVDGISGYMGRQRKSVF